MASKTYIFPALQVAAATGGATEAKQDQQIAQQQSTNNKLDTANTTLSSIDTKTVKSDTDNVKVIQSALPSGASTSALQTSTANSIISAIQTGPTTTQTVNVGNFPATQPVSAASLPLPSGAATSALQTSGNNTLSTISGQLPTALVSGRLPVDPSGVTSPVSVAALPLPSGASTSALQTTGNSSLSSIDGKVATAANQVTMQTTLSSIDTKTPSVGQKTSANSSPVVLASDQSAINVNVVSGGGGSTARIVVTRARLDYTATTVTTTAYTQLIASTTAAVTRLSIFDSSGSALVLALGAAGSEVDNIYIFPGGNGHEDVSVPSGSRVSIKAVDTNATVGQILITFFT